MVSFFQDHVLQTSQNFVSVMSSKFEEDDIELVQVKSEEQDDFHQVFIISDQDPDKADNMVEESADLDARLCDSSVQLTEEDGNCTTSVELLQEDDNTDNEVQLVEESFFTKDNAVNETNEKAKEASQHETNEKTEEVIELPNNFIKSLCSKIESYGNDTRLKLEAALALTALRHDKRSLERVAINGPFCPENNCWYIEHSQHGLLEHILLAHKKQGFYPCPISTCNQKRGNRPLIVFHAKEKHNLKMLTDCCLCGINFQNAKRLYKHIKKIHLHGEQPTHVISNTIEKMRTKKRHNYVERKNPEEEVEVEVVAVLLNEKNASPLQSLVSKQSYQKSKSLSSSPKQKSKSLSSSPKPSNSTKPNRYNCNVCHADDFSRASLRRHKKGYHPEMFTFLCELCSFRGDCSRSVRKHFAQAHRKRKNFASATHPPTSISSPNTPPLPPSATVSKTNKTLPMLRELLERFPATTPTTSSSNKILLERFPATTPTTSSSNKIQIPQETMKDSAFTATCGLLTNLDGNTHFPTSTSLFRMPQLFSATYNCNFCMIEFFQKHEHARHMSEWHRM